jgi:hypothetical protein
MGDTQNYNRPKLAVVNDTPIDITVKLAESGETLTDGGGSTGIGVVEFSVDANESVTDDVQIHGTFVITPTLGSTGVFAYAVAFTPKNGDGTNGTVQNYTFTHPQGMDAFQADAGRARQA